MPVCYLRLREICSFFDVAANVAPVCLPAICLSAIFTSMLEVSFPLGQLCLREMCLVFVLAADIASVRLRLAIFATMFRAAVPFLNVVVQEICSSLALAATIAHVLLFAFFALMPCLCIPIVNFWLREMFFWLVHFTIIAREFVQARFTKMFL